MSCLSTILLCLSCVLLITDGARILGIFIIPSYSHQIVFQPIYRELSIRGHEVTVFTPNPLSDPTLTNLTEIDISFVYDKHHSTMMKLFTESLTYPQVFSTGQKWVNEITEDIIQTKEFKKFYENQETFDLVMVEGVSNMMSALGYLFKAPTIGVYSMESSIDKYMAMGGIIHPAIYGGFLLDFDYPISLWQKIQNTYNILWHKFYVENVSNKDLDKITRKYFGNDFPSMTKLGMNVSMLFITKNPVLNSIRPIPPNILMLDFMHIQKPKPLPTSLANVLNNATQGAIYFSLGSNVKSSTLPPRIKDAIIECLNNLPYTVLWKWESDDVPGVKENVLTRKWFPQQDVLAHPNVKGFVTQGGLQSSDEAIARGVPLIGIPFLADQHDNIKKLENLGVAIPVPLDSLTSDTLRGAIVEIVENKQYSNRMKELHDVALDQPMTGLERAVWWSEYVIRHKGAPALKSVLADVPLYEYLMLDVIAVVLVVLVISKFVIQKILSSLIWILADFTQKKKLE